MYIPLKHIFLQARMIRKDAAVTCQYHTDKVVFACI